MQNGTLMLVLKASQFALCYHTHPNPVTMEHFQFNRIVNCMWYLWHLWVIHTVFHDLPPVLVYNLKETALLRHLLHDVL